MARLPTATPLSLTLSASSINTTLYVGDVIQTYLVKDFVREEFLNSRINQAQDNVTYARPTIVTNAVNAPVQIAVESCGFANAVPLGPEDLNLPNVFQRMNITQYEITGTPSSPSAVASLIPVWDEHKRRLDYFEYYLDELKQNISYQRLLELRGLNFWYLTSTGLTIVDPYQFGTVNNCLVTDFNAGVIHVDRANGVAVTEGWKMTVQSISITTRNDF